MAEHLAEFLLARFVEDESSTDDHWQTESGSRRLLAECEAKRQRVGLLVEAESSAVNVLSSYAYHLLTIEALPYADHPDYQDEWRP